jgi:hypothetical protein
MFVGGELGEFGLRTAGMTVPALGTQPIDDRCGARSRHRDSLAVRVRYCPAADRVSKSLWSVRTGCVNTPGGVATDRSQIGQYRRAERSEGRPSGHKLERCCPETARSVDKRIHTGLSRAREFRYRIYSAQMSRRYSVEHRVPIGFGTTEAPYRRRRPTQDASCGSAGAYTPVPAATPGTHTTPPDVLAWRGTVEFLAVGERNPSVLRRDQCDERVADC